MSAFEKLTSPNTKVFVVIAGNIGCGKTTLTKKLSERLNWKPFYESVSDNPYLDDFYHNMPRWSFELQVYFLTHRFETHKLIEKSNFSAIQDRSIYEDANIFARALFEQGDLGRRDYENYIKLFETMTAHLDYPTVMVYLRRSVPKLLERIRSRGRGYEEKITVDYLKKLNGYYDDWYENYGQGKRIMIETDELDFLENEDHFNGLVNNIWDNLDQKDIFFPGHNLT
jgi:deoxyadenosine/deoxycytidine kinase